MVGVKLPPLPDASRVAPPPRRKSGSYSLESDTPTRTLDTRQLAAVISTLEYLTPRKRDRLVAIADLLRDLTDEQVERLLDAAIAMNGL